MQTLELDQQPTVAVDPNSPPIGFWKRQFQEEQTHSQKAFDWIFGVAMPAVCFYFDPIVFKTSTFGMRSLNVGWTLFGQYRPFAYLFTFAAIIAMTGWLLPIKRLRSLSAAFGALFGVSAITAFIIGVLLFPFSLFGLLVLIGVLGFVPLFTSFVYLRNSVNALRIARKVFEKRTVIYSGVLTGLFSLVIPYVTNVEINKRLDDLVQGDASAVQKATNGLIWVAPLVNTDEFIEAFGRANYTSDPVAKKKALANAYYQITGDDLETAADNSCPGC